MASPYTKLSLALFFMSSLFLKGSLGIYVHLCVCVLIYGVTARTGGDVVCEDLPMDKCALAIAASGKRCLLEKKFTTGGEVNGVKGEVLECKTSEVMVERLANYIETDACVAACGVDRKAVGISSDALLESGFVAKLCSPHCYHHCSNIVDLYYNLAAGEGVSLVEMCEKQRTNPRRVMAAVLSSGVAPGPISSTGGFDFSPLSAAAPSPAATF